MGGTGALVGQPVAGCCMGFTKRRAANAPRGRAGTGMCSGLMSLQRWISNLYWCRACLWSAGSGPAADSAGLKPSALSKAAAVAHVFCWPHASHLSPTLCHFCKSC